MKNAGKKGFCLFKLRKIASNQQSKEFTDSFSQYHLIFFPHFTYLESKPQNSLTFSESCDLHLNDLIVLNQIDEVSFLSVLSFQLYHLKQLCSLELTLPSSRFTSDGHLIMEEILLMVHRILLNTMLGKLEKLHLILITLFSYLFLLGTQLWSALVLSAGIHSVKFACI